VGDDGETHQGIYDIALFKAVPNMTILAPGCRQEMASAMDYAFSLNGPCMLRFPKGSALSCDDLAAPWETGRGRLLSEGPASTLLITPGSLLKEASSAAAELREEGIYCDIYNLRFIKPLDEDYLAGILDSYSNVLCIEDAARIGGIGESIASLVLQRQLSCRFTYHGLPDTFYAQGTREELLAEFELDSFGIAGRIRKVADSELALYSYNRKRKAEGA